MRGARHAFVAAALAWSAALPLAAYGASRPAGSSTWYAFALLAYTLGSAVCHQRPERSFHLWSSQLPVCARCTGIYAGAALAGLVAVAGSAVLQRASQRIARSALVALAIAAAPALVTLAYEWTTGRMPANWIRGLSGVPLGAMLAVVVLSAVRPPSRP
jgi:uncharacterized membrane protein